MIVINARFLTQSITGVQRFAIELSKQIINLYNKEEIEFVTSNGILHNELARNLGVRIIGRRKGHLWEQIDLPNYLNKLGKPLLINLCSTAPIFYKNQIVTHHDITYIRYPSSFSKKFVLLYRLLVPQMFKNSRKIITVSNFSKEEISEYYSVNKDKIEVIYNGVNSDQFNIFSRYQLPNSLLEKKFLLGVSSNNLHKNFNSLLKAFQLVRDDYKHTDLSLCIVGATNSLSFKHIDFYNIKGESEIQLLGRVDDNTLTSLYQHAEGFIFPSFYEGFGIPPLEAQACGCPVLAANAASIPEILGGSAFYFDPKDINDIASKVDQYLRSNEMKLILRNKGFENVQKYSWKTSAERLVELCDEILTTKCHAGEN